MKKFLLGLGVLALIAIALIALPLPRAHAQSAGQGKIEGQVVNQTQDAPPASGANMDVVLVTVPVSSTTMVTTTVKSDANGKFAFPNLETISTTRYFVTTNYATVDYFSDLLTFTSPNSTTLTTVVPIFESTTDASVVKVTQTHLIFDVQSPWLSVQEIIVIENSSDRVYIGKALAGPHRATLNLPVPPKAINIQFDDQNIDDTTLRGDEVLTYTQPIGPGPDQIIFQYAVPFVPPAYDFSMKMPFATDKMGIYAMDIGQTMTSPQLATAPNPMANTPGAPKFIALAADKIAAGTNVTAKFANLPAATDPTAQSGSGTTAAVPVTDNSQTIGLIVLGLAAVVAIGLIALPLLRRRQAAQIVAAEMKTGRVDLLQDIADLDDEFEANKITEAEYKEQRAALKAKLLELDK